MNCLYCINGPLNAATNGKQDVVVVLVRTNIIHTSVSCSLTDQGQKLEQAQGATLKYHTVILKIS